MAALLLRFIKIITSPHAECISAFLTTKLESDRAYTSHEKGIIWV